MKVFGKKGYNATMEELDENLIGKNVIDMLNPSDVSWGIFQMSLAYLMFLKRERSRTKEEDVQTDDLNKNTLPS